jgi:hypothetical protein
MGPGLRRARRQQPHSADPRGCARPARARARMCPCRVSERFIRRSRGLMDVDSFGQLPGAPGQQRPHAGGADRGSANKRVLLTNAQAPGHAARLGARQPAQRRTDHLFLRCPEQHRRTLEPKPEWPVGARLSSGPRLAGGPVIARRTIGPTACLSLSHKRCAFGLVGPRFEIMVRAAELRLSAA